MDNKNVFSRNLNYYLNATGKSRREVSDALGVSYYTFSDWCLGRKYPRMDKVEKLADYFGILKSDLIEDKKEKPTAVIGSELSEKDKEIIDRVMKLSDSQKAALEVLLQAIEGK